MSYVDGFVIPMPKKNVKAYTKMAKIASKVWMEHGALEYRECVGDDLEAAGVTSFLKLAKVKPDETVVFAWIVYKSKADRKRVLKLVMADPRLQEMMAQKEMPFDVRRMTYGGFKTVVKA
jgi:uncharacterized protein YbaA (DUF1428 family)